MYFHLIDRVQLKAESRALLRSAKVSPIRMTALLFAVSFVLEIGSSATLQLLQSRQGSRPFLLSFFFLWVVLSLMSSVLSVGYQCYCLGVRRGREMPYTSLFDAFSFAVKLVGLLLVEGVLIFCWSLLFFVPGIIAFYRYSFAVWNLCSNPELGVLQALSLSQQQTRGYKMQLFLLHLSFLLWFLPVIAANVAAELFVWPFVPGTFAVILLVQAISYVLSSALLLYVMPYYTLCECGFYLYATAPVEKEEGEAPFLPDM